jgi:hypothetical protein
MKMSSITAPVLLAAALVAGGCYAPQPTTLYHVGDIQEPLETDDDYLEMARCWADLSRSNYGVWKSLSDNQKETLNQLWTKAHQEQLRDGKLSPATKSAIAAERKVLNDKFEQQNIEKYVSFDAIASNPTPDMNGELESWDRRRQGDSMIYNQNLRMLADEWSRFWLMERPGASPYDTVNTSGRF